MTRQSPDCPFRHLRSTPIPPAVFKRCLNGLLALSADDPETPILVGGQWNGHPLDLAALQELVETYNPEAQPAPVKLTHSEDQGEAYGWVTALRLGDWTPPGQSKPLKTLFAKLSLTEAGRTAVQSGAYRMKSIEAWPRNHPSNPTRGRWHFRGLALLGADSPGCPNLAPLMLAAEDTEPETPVLVLQADSPLTPGGPVPPITQGDPMALTPEQEAELAKAKEIEAQNKALVAKLAAQDQAAQAALVKTRLDGLVKAGRITPYQATVLQPVLLAMPADGVVTLAENKTAPARDALFSLLDDAKGHGLLKSLQLKADEPAEGDKTQAMAAAVAKHKAAGKSHAEAVSLAAKEVDGKAC